MSSHCKALMQSAGSAVLSADGLRVSGRMFPDLETQEIVHLGGTNSCIS